MSIYLYQRHLIRKQQHASVMPYLRMGYSYDDNRFELMVFNEGLRPAFIAQINTYYQDKKYSNMDIPDFFQYQY